MIAFFFCNVFPLNLFHSSQNFKLAAAHEDIERLERSIVADFHGNPRGHRDKLAQAHRVRRALDAIKERARFLLDAHADADGRRRAEGEA